MTGTLSRRALLRAALAAAPLPAVLPRAAHAQSPASVRFLLGFPPGGGIDVVVRTLAEQLRAAEGWTTVVENRPGASGQIAIGALRTAPPEPTTLLASPIEILTLLPHVYRIVSFDPFRDVTPVAAMVESPYAIAVAAKSEFRSLEDLVKWCRSNPDRASYGTPGEGTPQHLLGQVFAREAGIRLTHVAYKGGPPAIQDLIGGQIPIVIATYSALAGQRAAGNLRVLAHSGRARVPLIDGVPTFAELGHRGVVAESAFLLFATPAVPSDTVTRIASAVDRQIGSAAFAASVAKMGLRPVTLSQAELQALMRDNHAFWQKATSAPDFRKLD